MVKAQCAGCLQSAAGLFEAAGKPEKAADLYLQAELWEDARRLGDVSGSTALHLSLAAALEGTDLFRDSVHFRCSAALSRQGKEHTEQMLMVQKDLACSSTANHSAKEVARFSEASTKLGHHFKFRDACSCSFSGIRHLVHGDHLQYWNPHIPSGE